MEGASRKVVLTQLTRPKENPSLQERQRGGEGGRVITEWQEVLRQIVTAQGNGFEMKKEESREDSDLAVRLEEREVMEEELGKEEGIGSKRVLCEMRDQVFVASSRRFPWDLKIVLALGVSAHVRLLACWRAHQSCFRNSPGRAHPVTPAAQGVGASSAAPLGRRFGGALWWML